MGEGFINTRGSALSIQHSAFSTEGSVVVAKSKPWIAEIAKGLRSLQRSAVQV